VYTINQEPSALPFRLRCPPFPLLSLTIARTCSLFIAGEDWFTEKVLIESSTLNLKLSNHDGLQEGLHPQQASSSMDAESSSFDVSVVPETQSHAKIQPQLRSRKPREARPRRSMESKQPKSEEDTPEGVATSENNMSSTEDLINEDESVINQDDKKSAEQGRWSDASKLKPFIPRREDVFAVGHDMTSYIRDLVKNALRLAKPFLTVLVALWLLTATTQHFIFPSIEKSLVFGCRLPFASRLRLCQIPSEVEVPKVDETMEAQNDYGEVLQFVSVRRELPFDLLVSANKAADLQIDVAQSDLPSRDALGREFGRFDRDINNAAATFREFLAQVQSSGQALIDADLTMIQQLDSLNQSPSVWTETVKFLNIFSGYNPPIARVLSTIFDEYLLLLDLSIERIDEVYNITEKTLAGLETLRQDTLRIYAITRADEKRIKDAKSEEERKWWKKRRVLEALQGQLQLLSNVDVHRDKAVVFVTEVRDKVENIRVALNGLKRQAMKPKAQYKWGKVSEDTLERHLRAWHKALGHQIVSLEQRLEAVAPGSPGVGSGSPVREIQGTVTARS
jgi:hypothetical protein